MNPKRIARTRPLVMAVRLYWMTGVDVLFRLLAFKEFHLPTTLFYGNLQPGHARHGMRSFSAS